ncbi:hypothetical protein NEMBOFW57_008421 [Staphylotrichum longicolle]|uniref:DSBA-like thioredoxin domain-containing protein n=1 Tax=Staphylotrichum longicolle TaxID=669026 RepID=A0AAD4EVK6_9PEZI|nr:hypothetical protein NEMBOFW57_008421 [Staphylotrichum longicolle]
MAKFTFEIDVYSDPICPWCYLGKEALDRAMDTYTAQHPEAEFKLNWKPYLLWPNAGVSAYDKGASLRAVYGPNAAVMFDRLARLGAQYGIEFKWEGKTGSSRDAHKLMLLAMEKDAAAAAAAAALSSPLSWTSPNSPPTPEPATTTTTTTTTTPGTPQPSYKSTHLHRTQTHLYTATFQHGHDISSRAFLARAAVELGLFPTEAAALAYLARDDDDNNNNETKTNGAEPTTTTSTTTRRAPQCAVDAASARARQVGVSAVPSYVVQARWQVGGMQAEEVWMGVFGRVRAAVEAEGEGGGC